MKYTAVLATVVAVVSSQACDTSLIPACARTLLDANVKAITGCEPTDFKCTCLPASQSKLTSALTSQVIAACGADKVGDVLSGTEKFCSAVAAGACAGGGSSSSAAQSSATAAPSSTSPSASPSRSASTTTAGSATTSAPRPSTTTSATTSAPRPSTTGTLPSPSGNGTTRPTGPPVQAGAGMLTAAGSGLIVAIIGAFALL